MHNKLLSSLLACLFIMGVGKIFLILTLIFFYFYERERERAGKGAEKEGESESNQAACPAQSQMWDSISGP